MIDSPNLRCRIVDILFKQGYPDYAIAVGAFRSVKDSSLVRTTPCETDGQNLLIHAILPDDELSIWVRHQILHIILQHRARRGARRRREWTEACDYEISNYYSVYDENVIAQSAWMYGLPTVANAPQYANMVAEEIFDKIVASQSSPNPKSSDLTSEDHTELYDQIVHNVAASYDLLDADQQEQIRNSSLLPEERKSQLGGPPTDGLAVAQKPIPIEIQFQYSLRRYFLRQQNVDKGRTYRRPNKKYADSEFIVKARTNQYKPTKTLAVYVDTSGSMSKEKLAKALGTLDRLNHLKRVNIVTCYFDTSVREDFRPGGGTDYNCIFQHAKSNNYTCLAIITDDTTCRFNDHYTVEALWVAEIDPPGHRGRFAMNREVNIPSGHITAKFCDITYVGQEL